MNSRLKTFAPVSNGTVLLALLAALVGAALQLAQAEEIPPQPTCTAIGNPASGIYTLSATDDTEFLSTQKIAVGFDRIAFAYLVDDGAQRRIGKGPSPGQC